MTEPTLDTLAATLGVAQERLHDLIEQALLRLPQRRYYVFRSRRQPDQADAPDAGLLRTIVAFPSPDDALGFAQRNGYGSHAQLRAIDAGGLVLRMLAEPTIGTLLFIHESAAGATPGWGAGVRIERAQLLAQVHQTSSGPAALVLSAARYDSLQFGVEFSRRAEFRVALALAVEQVVASYVPPVGSLDRGPRSIFATAAVEAWLRTHGFPHAHQRRWFSVDGAPDWGGADEVYEIDAGTANRLLIQLLIHHEPSGRQYIKRVNITA